MRRHSTEPHDIMRRRSSEPVALAARQMRRSMTPAERTLWRRLRGGAFLGIRFRRQHPVGRFILYFCSLERRLAVEVDGPYHLSRAEYDQEREHCLQDLGFKVLRFTNDQVRYDIDGVLAEIAIACCDGFTADEDRTPPTP